MRLLEPWGPDPASRLLQNFVGVDASTFSVAVQQHRRLLGIDGNDVLLEIKALPDFHKEMMRLGSTFTDYPCCRSPRASPLQQQ